MDFLKQAFFNFYVQLYLNNKQRFVTSKQFMSERGDFILQVFKPFGDIL